MLGLGDEYPAKKGKKARSAAHDVLVRTEFGHGVPRRRDGRVMSNGEDIEPEHGVTFMEALRVVTKMKEWSFEAKPPMAVPSEPMDQPLPKPKQDPLAPEEPEVAFASWTPCCTSNGARRTRRRPAAICAGTSPRTASSSMPAATATSGWRGASARRRSSACATPWPTSGSRRCRPAEPPDEGVIQERWTAGGRTYVVYDTDEEPAAIRDLRKLVDHCVAESHSERLGSAASVGADAQPSGYRLPAHRSGVGREWSVALSERAALSPRRGFKRTFPLEIEPAGVGPHRR